MKNTTANEKPMFRKPIKGLGDPFSWLRFAKRRAVTRVLQPAAALAVANARASRWFLVAVGSLSLVGLCIVCLTVLALMLPGKLNRPQFILSPGIAALETVRPGEMPASYVEKAFGYVTSLVNGWTYETVEDNFNELYAQFYTKELAVKTKANLKAIDYFGQAKEKSLVSLWRPLPKESDFRWCGEVSVMKEQKGVACGIVTGEQRLFYEHNEPLSTRKISYLIFAVNVAPNTRTPGKNFFSLEVVKIKRGDRQVLQTELDEAFNKGTLPPDDEENYVR